MEKEIEERLRTAVKRSGGMAIKFFAPSFTGLPDRIVLLPGRKIGFVEVKQPGKQPSARQAFVHRSLIRLGFQVHVLDRPEQVPGIITAILEAES